MTLENIYINAAIADAEKLLKDDKQITPPVRAVMSVLLIDLTPLDQPLSNASIQGNFIHTSKNRPKLACHITDRAVACLFHNSGTPELSHSPPGERVKPHPPDSPSPAHATQPHAYKSESSRSNCDPESPEYYADPSPGGATRLRTNAERYGK